MKENKIESDKATYFIYIFDDEDEGDDENDNKDEEDEETDNDEVCFSADEGDNDSYNYFRENDSFNYFRENDIFVIRTSMRMQRYNTS